MTADRTARLVVSWVRLYTRGLSASVADRRIAEIAADLHDHIEHARSQGIDEHDISRSLTSRWLRGTLADLRWRTEQGWRIADHVTPQEAARMGRSAYRRAVALTSFGVLALFWLLGAVGVIGSEGDGADRWYLGVFAIAVVGTIGSRLRPRGMAWTLAAMSAATAAIGVMAVVAGMIPEYNTAAEIIALNAGFAALFAGAAWLFRRSRMRPRRV